MLYLKYVLEMLHINSVESDDANGKSHTCFGQAVTEKVLPYLCLVVIFQGPFNFLQMIKPPCNLVTSFS
jgi:hypothetical protein